MLSPLLIKEEGDYRLRNNQAILNPPARPATMVFSTSHHTHLILAYKDGSTTSREHEL